MYSVLYSAFLIQAVSSLNLFGYEVDFERFEITKHKQCERTVFIEDITIVCRFVDVQRFAVFNFSVYEEDNFLHIKKKSQLVQFVNVNQVGERNVTFRVCFNVYEEYPPDFEYYFQFYHNCSDFGTVSRSSSDDYEYNCQNGGIVVRNHSITVPRGLESRPARTPYEDEWW